MIMSGIGRSYGGQDRTSRFRAEASTLRHWVRQEGLMLVLASISMIEIFGVQHNENLMASR